MRCSICLRTPPTLPIKLFELHLLRFNGLSKERPILTKCRRNVQIKWLRTYKKHHVQIQKCYIYFCGKQGRVGRVNLYTFHRHAFTTGAIELSSPSERCYTRWQWLCHGQVGPPTNRSKSKSFEPMPT